MTRDAEMTAHRLRLPRAGQHRHRDRRVRSSRIPGYAAQAVSPLSAPANRERPAHDLGAGVRRLLEEAEPGSDHQLTFARCFASTAHSPEAFDVLEGLLAGSVSSPV